MKKLRILLIEDDPASIESAKIQLSQYDLTIVTTVDELVSNKITWPEPPYDLVLTDMNIPLGAGLYQVMRSNLGTTLVPVGLAVYSRCLEINLPCIIVTDSDGHHDMLGLVCEKMSVGDIRTDSQNMAYRCQTRPEWIDTPKGKGKDWMSRIKLSGYDIVKDC